MIERPTELSQEQYSYMRRLLAYQGRGKLDSFNEKMSAKIDNFLEKTLTNEQQKTLNEKLRGVEYETEPNSYRRQVIHNFMNEEASSKQWEKFEKGILNKEAKAIDKLINEYAASPEKRKEETLNYISNPVNKDDRKQIKAIREQYNGNPEQYQRDREYLRLVDGSVREEYFNYKDEIEMPESSELFRIDSVTGQVSAKDKKDVENSFLSSELNSANKASESTQNYIKNRLR